MTVCGMNVSPVQRSATGAKPCFTGETCSTSLLPQHNHDGVTSPLVAMQVSPEPMKRQNDSTYLVHRWILDSHKDMLALDIS